MGCVRPVKGRVHLHPQMEKEFYVEDAESWREIGSAFWTKKSKKGSFGNFRRKLYLFSQTFSRRGRMNDKRNGNNDDDSMSDPIVGSSADNSMNSTSSNDAAAAGQDLTVVERRDHTEDKYITGPDTWENLENFMRNLMIPEQSSNKSGTGRGKKERGKYPRKNAGSTDESPATKRTKFI